MILLQPTDNKTINIALTGKMRSGKDTVAKQLIKAFEDDSDTRVVMFGFGDALKEYAQELFLINLLMVKSLDIYINGLDKL